MDFSVDSLEEDHPARREKEAVNDIEEGLAHISCDSYSEFPTRPEFPPTTPAVDFECLSPWEKWVIRKTRQERERRLLLFEKMMEEQQSRVEERKKKTERRRKADQSYHDWIAEKGATEKRQTLRMSKTRKEEVEKESQRYRLVRERTKENFEKWCRLKEDEKEKERKGRAEQCRAKVEAELHHRDQAEMAYQDWLQNVRRRSKHDCWWRSSGYSFQQPLWTGRLD